MNFSLNQGRIMVFISAAQLHIVDDVTNHRAMNIELIFDLYECMKKKSDFKMHM